MSNNHWLKTVFSILVLFSFFINSFPVKAQDIVESDDISGGSSVFVFRQSRKAPVQKLASRNFMARSQVQKTTSRKAIREEIARVIPPKRKPPTQERVDVKQNNALTKVQLSEQVAKIGQANLEAKNYDEAVKAFRSALIHNPKNVNAKLGLSEALVAKGDMAADGGNADAALASYQEAKTLDPANAAAAAGIGGVYESQNKTDLALQSYEEAVKLNPNLKEIYAPLGAIYYEKGEIAKADNYLSKAAPNEQTQYLIGMIRYKQNRDEEAAAALKKSLEIKPSAEAHYYLGEVYDRMNITNESIAEYNEAIKLDPNYAEAYFDLGAAYYNRGRYEEAATTLEKAVTKNNNSPEANQIRSNGYETLGDAYRQLKKYKEAEGNYNIAIALIDRINRRTQDPKGVADLYSKQGFVQGRLLKWGAAINSLESATKSSPDAYDYTNLGWAYYNAAQQDKSFKREADAKNKLAQGKAVLQKAAAMNVNNAGTYMNLGLTQNDLGEYSEAAASFEKCLQLRSNWVLALNELGFAQRYLNKLDDAVSNFRRATELNNRYYPAFYNLAEAEFRRGNKKEAKKAQEAMLKIDPNSKYLQNLSKRLDVIFTGAILTNPAQQLENKVKGKIPKIPGLPY